MTALDRATLAVRFFGDSLDPDELTHVLGATPSLAYRKGDRCTSAAGELVRQTGAWVLATDSCDGHTLDGTIGELFARLTHDLAVWDTLASRFRADLFCGLFMAQANEGLSLSPATLRMLADRQLEVGFDLYGPVAEF
jgi:hypothetical protein